MGKKYIEKKLIFANLMTRTDLPLSLSLSRKELSSLTLLKGSSVVLKGSTVVVVNWSSKNLE